MTQSDHHDITIRITKTDLEQARSEFPSTCPTKDPNEWSEKDLTHALAALYHKRFKIVGSQ